jgi:NADPH-dependent curcumin reductase
MKNNQLLLVSRPMGSPKENNFAVQSAKINPLSSGEVLIKNQYLSIDPAMRGWMTEGKSYINPVQIGGVMRAMGTGVVIDSKNPYFKVGDIISTDLGVQEYKLFDKSYPLLEQPQGKNLVQEYKLFDTSIKRGIQTYLYKINDKTVHETVYLGALGLSGMTSYFGILEVGKIQAGETVVISGAAGGVGSIAGQIAKLKGCTVIGITSSEEKCQSLINDFNFDFAVSYKTPNWKDQIMAISPNGVNLFFDNVGGDILNIMLSCMSKGGRVVISGAASQYNNMTFMRGPANYLSLITNRTKMEGFVGMDYFDQFEKARAEISQWINLGLINPVNFIIKGGVGDFLGVFNNMFAGKNLGKMVMELDSLN